jgi:hypothetical protein
MHYKLDTNIASCEFSILYLSSGKSDNHSLSKRRTRTFKVVTNGCENFHICTGLFEMSVEVFKVFFYDVCVCVF